MRLLYIRKDTMVENLIDNDLVIHSALWDYAEKKGIQIEGLEKPVSDISEHEEAAEE